MFRVLAATHTTHARTRDRYVSTRARTYREISKRDPPILFATIVNSILLVSPNRRVST